jgi:hypothetical protein
MKREPLAGIELGLWAREAVCCSLCSQEWTPETMDSRDARCVSVEPRRMACAECLIRYGAKALHESLKQDKSQEGK